MEPDRAAVAAYWTAFCAATGVRGELADVFAFGDSAAMADQLLALVVTGPKRATAGAVEAYRDEGVAIPLVGHRAVVVDGQGRPGAVIRTTDVRVGALSSVDDAFAWDEGEGDRSRASWLAGHGAFFRRWFAATGRPPDEDPAVVFQRFDLDWPR